MVKRPFARTAACAVCRIAAAAASANAAVSATRTSRGAAALMVRSYLFVERTLPFERGAIARVTDGIRRNRVAEWPPRAREAVDEPERVQREDRDPARRRFAVRRPAQRMAERVR